MGIREFEPEMRGLVSRIEPTQPQKAGAVRSHNYLRELLQTGQFGSRILDTYLTGSYARDTAIAPLDDVDMVVVFDPTEWQSGFLFGKPAPEKILQSFASAIRYRYPESSLRTQRRSICLSLNHLDIDVVPATNVAGEGHRIEIPDGDSGEWIISAPKVHTAIATEVNLRHRGLFKPLVKLLKSWNSELPQTARLKSFALRPLG
jgi:Second Messenger Oligonucleotide or Dinucleotide Synthetase domain